MHTPQTTVIFILVFACFHCNGAEILPQLHRLCLTLDIEKGMVMYILFILLEYPPVIYCCRNYIRELVDPICWDGTDKPIMSIQALHNAHINNYTNTTQVAPSYTFCEQCYVITENIVNKNRDGIIPV